jgi:ABC-type multidrug transport system ATPase subunit
MSILLVEQAAKTALSIADRAAVISMGRIVVVGSPEEIEVSAVDIYLGSAISTQTKREPADSSPAIAQTNRFTQSPKGDE